MSLSSPTVDTAMVDTERKLLVVERDPFIIIIKDGEDVRVEVAATSSALSRYHDLVKAELTPQESSRVDSAYHASLDAVEDFVVPDRLPYEDDDADEVDDDEPA